MHWWEWLILIAVTAAIMGTLVVTWAICAVRMSADEQEPGQRAYYRAGFWVMTAIIVIITALGWNRRGR